MKVVRKNKYSLNDFLDIISTLRRSKRRMWNDMQTHVSMRTDLIEGVYDVVEAIDVHNIDMLKDKLGDMLFQLAVHCNIEEEKSNFSFEDVVDEVSRKIVMRYPHIFSQYYDRETNYRTHNIRSFSRNNIKHSNNIMRETSASGLESISKVLPSLMRAAKIQEKAAREGYGMFSVEDAINESFEKLHHIEILVSKSNQEDYSKEIGDLLFCIAEIARLVNVDAESALYDSSERFKEEFLYKISLANRNEV